jgi:hypothetical protein
MSSDPIVNPVADPAKEPLDDPGKQIRPIPGAVPDSEPLVPGASPELEEDLGKSYPKPADSDN